MNRSTNTAPVSLSTSYLIGSPCIGISMMTLQSLGTSLPAGTRSRFMAEGQEGGKRHYTVRRRPPIRSGFGALLRRGARRGRVDDVDVPEARERDALGGLDLTERPGGAPRPD